MKPIMIYHFCLKERKLRKNEEHVADLQYKKECYTHTKFKAGIKSQISIRKCA